MSLFLERLQEYRKAFALMCELSDLGHPVHSSDPDKPQRRALAAGDEVAAQQFSVRALRDALELWKVRLEEVSDDHPWLRFYSTREAQRLHGLVHSDEYDIDEISLVLLPLFQRTPSLAGSLRVAITRAQTQMVTRDQGVDWPASVGSFLRFIQQGMPDQALPIRPFGANPVHWPGIHVHTINASSSETMLLVHRIYNRLPEAFEILWCSNDVDVRTMERFLDRVRHFASDPDASGSCKSQGRCFTLLQVETLRPTVQQALLRHLLASRNMSSGQNLHCIQSSATALQAAPWINHHKDLLGGSHPLVSEQLRKWTVDGQHISSVKYVTGPAGSGKTHYTKKCVAAWRAEGKNVCLISITEAFSIKAVALKLHETVLNGRGNVLGLCFHVNVGKFRTHELPQWKTLMEAINRFFFCLLVRFCWK